MVFFTGDLVNNKAEEMREYQDIFGKVKAPLGVDANLAGVSASPAASALATRGLPFIVLSGYSREQLENDFPGALFMQKPCRPAQLIHAVSAMVLKRPARSG